MKALWFAQRGDLTVNRCALAVLVGGGWNDCSRSRVEWNCGESDQPSGCVVVALGWIPFSVVFRSFGLFVYFA